MNYYNKSNTFALPKTILSGRGEIGRRARLRI